MREVTIRSAGFTLADPGRRLARPTASYLVGNEPVGGLDGRVGIVTESGITALTAIGRAADPLGGHRGVARPAADGDGRARLPTAPSA